MVRNTSSCDFLFQSIVLCFISALYFSNTVNAQVAGLSLHAGLYNGIIQDKTICPEYNFQSGYMFGADAALNSGGLWFMASGDYGRFDQLPVAKIDYFSNKSMNLFRGKAGMGFKIFGLSEKVYFSSKLQLCFDLVSSFSQEALVAKKLKINDGFMGAVTGIAFQYGALLFEFEYEKGILNLYYEQPETKIDFFGIKTGVKF